MSYRTLVVGMMFIAVARPCTANEPLSNQDAATNQHANPIGSVVRDDRWDALFTRSEGWNGGDVAGTIDLGDGRQLWIFGDTTIGIVRDGIRQPGMALVNNSVAIHPWKPAKSGAAWAGDPPIPETMRFDSGPPGPVGRPSALFQPVRAADAATNRQFTEMQEYWPTGGGCVVRRTDDRRLYLGLARIRKVAGDQGVWGFRRVGCSLGIVDDIAQPVEKWRPRVLDIPFAVGDLAGTPEHPAISWGESFVHVSQNGLDTVLIFGVRNRSQFERELIAAQVPAEKVEDFSQWRFVVEGGRRSSHLDDAVKLAEAMAPEFSIEPLRHGTFDGYVMVQNELALGPGILVRIAKSPLGPWSQPREIFRAPEPATDKELFSYAAKGHVALSRPDELLVTYVVNAHKFSRMCNDASIYRPRFLRVPLSMLPSLK